MSDVNQINREKLSNSKQTEKDGNYRKLIVRILLSLPHRPGILEFMDFIYRVEAGEGEKSVPE